MIPEGYRAPLNYRCCKAVNGRHVRRDSGNGNLVISEENAKMVDTLTDRKLIACDRLTLREAVKVKGPNWLGWVQTY